MKIRYYADTDTLYIEFRDAPVVETRELDENTMLDLDSRGDICAITVEHASDRAGIPQFSYEQVSALAREPAARANYVPPPMMPILISLAMFHVRLKPDATSGRDTCASSMNSSDDLTEAHREADARPSR